MSVLQKEGPREMQVHATSGLLISLDRHLLGLGPLFFVMCPFKLLLLLLISA